MQTPQGKKAIRKIPMAARNDHILHFQYIVAIKEVYDNQKTAT